MQPDKPAPTIGTYAEIFSTYGPADLMAWMKVSRQYLRVLKSRGRIPSDRWPALREGAAHAGRPLPDGALERAEIHFCRARAATPRASSSILKGLSI